MPARIKYAHLIFISTISLSVGLSALADTFNEEWRWVHFTTESGLPSNHVYNLVETSDGTVWVATSHGLAWYDGFQWQPINDTSIFGKSPEWMTAMEPDSLLIVVDNRLYIASKSYARMVHLEYDNKVLNIKAAAPIGENNFIFLSAFDINLYLFDGRTHKMTIDQTELPPSDKGFFHTKSGGIWLNTYSGLLRWDGIKWNSKLKVNVGISYKITNLVENRDTLAFAAIKHPIESLGLWEWRGDSSPKHLISEGRDPIQTMDISQQGEAIAVYESGNVRVFNGTEWSSLVTIPSQLRNILFIKFRENGDLWVGTERGLNLLKRSSHRWSYWKHSFPNLNNIILEILRTRDGSIWLATAQGLEIHKSDGTIQNIERIHGNKIIGVTGLCEDDEGNIWISSGADFKGSYRWNGNKWRHFGSNDGLDAPLIHKIRKDTQGRLWFLGLGVEDSSLLSESKSQPGCFVYQSGKFKRWGEKEGLINGRVYSFAQTPDGGLWFGTLFGLSLFKNNRWRYWKDQDVFTLAIDKTNRIWFGDRNRGLGFIDGDNPVKWLTTDDGLVNNQVWDLKADEDGVLWIATHGGIASYKNGVFSTFNLSAGLNNLKVWPLLPLKDKLYAGTQGSGVAILSFEEADNPPPPNHHRQSSYGRRKYNDTVEGFIILGRDSTARSRHSLLF